MRFLVRVFWGLLILALCAGAIGLGAQRMAEARQEAAQERPRKKPPERIYTVRDILLEPVTARPTLTAYGTVEARRILELRAAAPGRVVFINDNLREGAQIRSGATLIRVDPVDARSRSADAEAALRDAQARDGQARRAVRLAAAELDAAAQQSALRRGALERQRKLAQQGYAAQSRVDDAQLQLSSAEQALTARRQALVSAQTTVEQAALAVERARITLADAGRAVSDTETTAPFTGLATDVSATLGRLVNTNETLGRLIDLGSLEAAFRASDAQFSRLLDARGALRPLVAKVILKLGERELAFPATLDRPAATAPSEGGRIVYASVRAQADGPLRPGDFVRVEIEEPPLENVARIPARAATEDGRILVIDEENRLEEVPVAILRRLPDALIVSGAPFGARIVAERRPQLGPGVKVRSFEEAAEAEAEAKAKKAARGGGGRRGGG